MFVVSGFFVNDSPAVNIKISGNSPDAALEVAAIIDTGFTGFISMPLISALPLGLIPKTTTVVILADGTSQTKVLAEGSASIKDSTQTGFIILEESSNEVLLGMDFLRTFLLMLVVTQEAVLLVDQSELKKFSQRVVRAVADNIGRLPVVRIAPAIES